MKLFNFLLYFFTVITLSQNTAISKKKKLQDSISFNIRESYNLTEGLKYKEASKLIISNIKLAITLKDNLLVSKGYSALAYLNSDLGNDSTAINYLNKAEKILISINNQKRLGIVYNNLAHEYYEKRKDTIKSIYYIKKAIQSYKKVNDYWGLAIAYSNLGEFLEKSNKLNKAIPILDSSIYYAKKVNKKYILSISHQLFSEVYFKKENFKKALKHIELSLKIAKKNNDEDILVKLYKLKYMILKKQKKQKEALIYLEKYQKLITIIQTNKKSRTLKKIASKFELKEREKLLENSILESKKNSNKLKKTSFYSLLVVIPLIISILSLLVLYKNNTIRKETAILLTSKNKQLKKLHLETESNLLKIQIQPYFFFETLNNLQGLIMQKSNKAKEYVLKLSEFMRYLLYGVKNINTTILDEIENIQNYLTLASLDHQRGFFSPIEIKGEMNEIMIPPLLFIQLIENSLNYTNVGDFKLDISFQKTKSNHLLFKVKNTIKSQIKHTHKRNTNTEIENAKRRLEIIYKDNYHLHFLRDKSTYSIVLKIPIVMPK